MKRASDERADRGTVTAPHQKKKKNLAFPTRFRAAPMARGSVSAEHSGDGCAFETASACCLTCHAGVCLFLAGWNIIAPWADRDKWWCGEYTPLSEEGVGLCSYTDRNKPCQKATGGLLLSLRPQRHRVSSRRVGSERLQELVSIFLGGRGSLGMFQICAPPPALTWGPQDTRGSLIHIGGLIPQCGHRHGNGLMGVSSLT